MIDFYTMNQCLKIGPLLYLKWVILTALASVVSAHLEFVNSSNFEPVTSECNLVSVKLAAVIGSTEKRRQGEALKISNTSFAHIQEENFQTALLCASTLFIGNNSFKDFEARITELAIEDIDLARSRLLNFLKNFTRLERISLVNTNLIEIPDYLLANLSNLRALIITGNKIERLTSKVFRGLSQLEELNLSNNTLRDISNDCFAELVNLKELRLDLNKISNLSSNIFVDNKHLKVLNLTKHNQIGVTISFKERLFRENLYLETLILRSNLLYDMDSEIFANLVRLRHLDLSSNSFVALKQTWFRDLHNLEMLLLFGNTELRNNPMELTPLRKLKALDIRMCGFKNFTNETFAGMESLDTIDLDGNNLRSLPQEIRLFYNNSKLRAVNLKNCNISRFNPNWFLNLPKLESVDLSCNCITSLSYKELMECMPTNSSKNLSLNFVGNELQRLYFRSWQTLRQQVNGSRGTVLVKINALSNNSRCDSEFIETYKRLQRNIRLLIESPRSKQCWRQPKKARSLNDNLVCDCEGDFSPCSCSYKSNEKAIKLDCQEKLEHLTQPSLLDWWPQLDSYHDYTIDINLSQNNLKTLPHDVWHYDSRIKNLNLSSNQLASQT